MELRSYWFILRRRWTLILAIVLLDVLVSGALYARAAKAASYQACTTLYVADASAPGIVAAPPTSDLSQLIAGETAANFFGDDIIDVAESQGVQSYVSGQLRAGFKISEPSYSAPGDLAVTGSRRDRTVQLCISNPSSGTALAGAQVLGGAMSTYRSRFIGKGMAKRTYVSVISRASVSRVSNSRERVNLLLRLILGVFVALGLALLWDWADPRVRDRDDVETALGAPVLSGP
ncbi:MAG: hypothetical protein PVSMB1_16310 [Gemmatimonadaceae bacterium]